MNWYRVVQHDLGGNVIGFWMVQARNAAHAFEQADRCGYIVTANVHVTQIGA